MMNKKINLRKCDIMRNKKNLMRLSVEEQKSIAAGRVLAMRFERTCWRSDKKYFAYEYEISGVNDEGGWIKIKCSSLKEAIELDRKLFKKENERLYDGKVKVRKYGFKEGVDWEDYFV